MTNENNTSRGPGFGSILVALLSGAAAGAAVVYLTAPRSGAETRRRLQATADGARDTAARFPDALRNATVAAREAFEETLREANHS